MSFRLRTQIQRWVIFVPGMMASLLPALWLTVAFAQTGQFWRTLAAFWVELLTGPVRYWLPILFGHSMYPEPDPMSGASIRWVYAVCLALTLAHPIKPHPLTAWITAAAFVAWYAWAFVTIGAYEY
jgi:hypothetical protein